MAMVPNVIRPTNALGGKRPSDMMMLSLSALSESSSWQVSTTNRKMGGVGAGRASLYSIVVLPGCSSGGMAFSLMSL